MSYNTGGVIQASDYNTLGASVNELFSDLHSGATTIPTMSYGYGQTPALESVSAGTNITADKWAALFQNVRNCGIHQGTTTVPPLPASGPIASSDIVAYSSISTLLTTLQANRYNLAVGQSSATFGTQYSGSGTWLSSLTYTFQVDFGSWNNARYFFNSGGFLGINGSYTSPSTPVEISWSNALTAMTVLKFTGTSTTPGSGSGGTSIGFYNLTPAYQTIYQANTAGAGYYSTSFIRVSARVPNPGANGLVDFEILLDDTDPTPESKSALIKFWCDNTKSSGAIVYPGTVSVGAGTFVNN